jgi:hypothetical protein
MGKCREFGAVGIRGVGQFRTIALFLRRSPTGNVPPAQKSSSVRLSKAIWQSGQVALRVGEAQRSGRKAARVGRPFENLPASRDRFQCE